ncbi:MAG TPA: hypothetical protein VLS25_13445 [Dehalococcoidia bacterium]|nr:hypothetical protein [Dehalococcoidia bacterium]
MRPLAVMGLIIGVAFAACGGDDGGASPTGSATPEVAAAEACPSAALYDKAPEDGPPHLSLGWEKGEIICWTDIAGEASYRVWGQVRYWIPPVPQRCGEPPSPSSSPVPLLDMPSTGPGFMQDLAADTTQFRLPPHSNPRMGIKDYSVRVEALDSDGNVVASGASSVTRDGFCE